MTWIHMAIKLGYGRSFAFRAAEALKGRAPARRGPSFPAALHATGRAATVAATAPTCRRIFASAPCVSFHRSCRRSPRCRR